MIFTCYVDESGIHASSKDFVLAGYVATTEQWSAFEVEWKGVLNEAGLSCFHMTDFANHAPPYDTWDDEQRKYRLARFIQVINDHTTCSVGIILSKCAYAEVLGKVSNIFPGREYGLALMQLMSLVPTVLRSYKQDPQIAYVLDRNAGGPFIHITDRIMKDQKKSEALGFLSIRSEDKRKFVAIQSADILAYELYRLATTANGTSNHPARLPILKMLKRETSFWYRPSAFELARQFSSTRAGFEFAADELERRRLR